MMILSSAKLNVSIQSKLRESYPEITFTFCKGMEEAQSYLDQAEVLITYGEDLNADLVEKATHLKWIMVLSAGMDEMPFHTIQAKGIMVTNVRGIHAIPMAEYAISMILQVSRNAKELHKHEQQHTWGRKVPMREITGGTMTVVGTGAIGQEVARLSKAFQMKTIGVSRSGKDQPHFDQMLTTDHLSEAVEAADFIVSVLPSTKETRHLYTYEHFEIMPSHAIFLNMGRGDAVQSDVLLKALNNHEIGHAVLDVFEQEPLPPDHPFWEHDKVTVTPHLSGISPEYVPRAIHIFVQNLAKYVSGDNDLINRINLNRGY
ncbi:D-2-hydroxyacid dehydrogenase [Aquibacillus sp. 3ASR75-11]|uniref:D-2-hydroxyacid dehydrogenase n=1 Tax=Terrihalobacillus insolitus TaxID=2950438 RepID=A0A9X4AMY7_9BACI|nr:D-2-hydroxyacid dehydrogenase [Terrihalobacillus insolitus]MDC3413418.1 D-2-hydroxyacid dehydrogenase [Terrihalobacillus insolitus]MDC3425289.1 D-2-hydroxyacid dehydrogenase [Terrihalobacillus insolitus]